MNTQPLSGSAKIRIQVCVCPRAEFFLLDPLPAILTLLTYSSSPSSWSCDYYLHLQVKRKGQNHSVEKDLDIEVLSGERKLLQR